MLGIRGCIRKNLSPKLVRDKAKIEYTSEEQPSTYELTFGVELGLNPHSKTTKYQIISRASPYLNGLS